LFIPNEDSLTKTPFGSDFCKSEMERLLASCTVKPQVHQFERHPYLPQDAFVAFHKEVWARAPLVQPCPALNLQPCLHFLQHDIHITAYSPLGNTNPLYAKDDKLTPIVQHPVIQHLAAKHGCTPANILISLQIKVRRSGRHTFPM
jgi:diketogulonate reductase-like aldo/keto reductase